MVAHPEWLGDGWCDDGLGYDPSYNSAICGYDHGDCCLQTCTSSQYPCGHAGYLCMDPEARQVNASRLAMRFLVANTSLTRPSDADSSALSNLVQMAILSYLLNASSMDVMELRIGVLASLQPEDYDDETRRMLSWVALDRGESGRAFNWTVSCLLVYSNVSEVAVNALADSVASGAMERALRLVARLLDHMAFAFVVVCGEDDPAKCIASQSSVFSTNQTALEGQDRCSRDDRRWRAWYGTPAALPISLLWYCSVLIALALWLARPLRRLLLCTSRPKLFTLQTASVTGQIHCILVRMLYLATILMEALQPQSQLQPLHLDELACIELSYLDEDCDPSYALLQSLFYLALLCTGECSAQRVVAVHATHPNP
jgi:hypothetical protein